MKRIVFASMTALAFSSIVSACGKNDSAALNAVADLDGTWVRACAADTQSGGGSQKASATYSGGTGTILMEFFTDDSCATPSLAFTLVNTNRGGKSLTSPAGAKELDSTPTKILLKLKTDEMVATFNGDAGNEPVCGGGFVKDTDQELTATACAGSGVFPTLFDPVYTIYKVEDSKFYTGDCGEDGTATDCRTPAKRATALSTDYLTKG